MEPDPFPGLCIADPSVLDELDARTLCPVCQKSRKYFCYSCFVPVNGLEDRLPRVKLPLKICIIKHPNEVDGKSTSGHAAVLAPEDVSIITYPCIPEFNPNEDILVFPDEDALTLEQILGTGALAGSQVPDSSSHSTETASANWKSYNFLSGVIVEENSAESCTLTSAVNSVVRSENDTLDLDMTNDTATSTKPKGDNSTKKPSQGEPEMQPATPLQVDGDINVTSGCGCSSITSSLQNKKCKELPENSCDITSSCSDHENRKRKLNPDQDGVVITRNPCLRETQNDKSSKIVVPKQISRAIFIDSTWHQTKRIVSDERLKDLRRVQLKSHTTKFWRSQQGIPVTCLSTIEAIYYFLREYHSLCVSVSYKGDYDNLLFFFSYMYHKIRVLRDGGARIKAYNR